MLYQYVSPNNCTTSTYNKCMHFKFVVPVEFRFPDVPFTTWDCLGYGYYYSDAVKITDEV